MSINTLNNKVVALKIDIDTEKGTRIGVPNLLKLFEEHNIKATFLFSMGPDNTGRAIRRIFKPGFFKKVSRTSVFKIYGLRTLLNGILFKGPHIGEYHGSLMKHVSTEGHEVGIHSYDHVLWHDKMSTWNEARVREEVNLSVDTFTKIFGFRPLTIGSAGWQANKYSLAAYDDHALTYASDTRGTMAFYPTVKRKIFKTLQIPTTLPTLDELLGRPEFPLESITEHYHSCIAQQSLNVLTLHAEIEGMAYLEWFKDFIEQSINQGIKFVPMITVANQLNAEKHTIPTRELRQGSIDGRAGTLAVHA